MERIIIEISDRCNAKCELCVTGYKNRYFGNERGINMSRDDFSKIYTHLEKEGIIKRETIFNLFGWGEPFLNSEMERIAGFLSEKGFSVLH